MELVPPPERVTLPAGVNLVQCFVCTAMFYTQEDHDKHLKLHRKSDILRAVSEHRLHHHHHHHHHHGHGSRSAGGSGGGGVLRPAADAGFKLDLDGEAAAAHHDLAPHHAHQSHHAAHHAAHHSQHHSPHHSALQHHAGWMEPRAPPPPPVPPPPPLALTHPAAAHHPIMLPELHGLHGWTLMGAAAAAAAGAGTDTSHHIIYPEPEAGPSGSSSGSGSGSGSHSHPPSEPASGDAELPAAELMCTEESLHSSCPSPGEPSSGGQLRPAPDYHVVQDFSIYSGAEAASGPPPPYSIPHSRRLGVSLAPELVSQTSPVASTAAAAAAGQLPGSDALPGQDFVSFKCIHCSREFGSAEDIHVHLSEVSEAAHVCQVCHEVCASTWHLDAHMERHSSPRPFKCGVCAREFRSPSVHRQHILQHIPPRIRDRVGGEVSAGSPVAAPAAGVSAAAAVVPDAVAPRIVPPRASVKGATMKMQVKKPVSCATCGAQFAFVSALQRHTLQQHKQQRRRPTRRICSCNHCGRIFYSYKQLKWHAEIHGKKPHTCATCGLRFLHESWLTRHIRGQHDPSHVGPRSADSKPCPICNRVYMRSSLQKHIRMMHQELKPHQCTRCGKRFAAKCNLQSHELSHLSYRDRPHKCTQCRKAYTTARDLRVHMTTHEGKKFPCKVCGREFSRASSMNLHLREHDGEKKHMCGVCGKRFARKAYLMGHVRIHTGERPHECAVCGRSFASRSNYNAHVKSHTRREPVNAEL